MAGRPRSPDADNAILDAVVALLAEGGLEGLSMDAVAARAGVSKATIYRRWSRREDVVAAAATRLSRQVPVPDTGSVRDDLRAIARGLAAVLAAPGADRLVSALVAAASTDPDLAAALRAGFLHERREAATQALARGQARGEIAPGADLGLLVDLLAGAIYYRLLLRGVPTEPATADALVDLLLAGAVRPRPLAAR